MIIYIIIVYFCFYLQNNSWNTQLDGDFPFSLLRTQLDDEFLPLSLLNNNIADHFDNIVEVIDPNPLFPTQLDGDFPISILNNNNAVPLKSIVEVIDPNQHPSWTAFLEGIKTSQTYRDRLSDFLLYRETFLAGKADPTLVKLELILLNYFLARRELTDDNGDRRHGSTSMRGWYSIFKAYWIHSDRGILTIPLIEAKLNQWDKLHEVEKSEIFSKNDLEKFLRMSPSGNLVLPLMQVYAVLAIAFAGRGCEILPIEFEDIKRVVQSNNEVFDFIDVSI